MGKQPRTGSVATASSLHWWKGPPQIVELVVDITPANAKDVTTTSYVLHRVFYIFTFLPGDLKKTKKPAKVTSPSSCRLVYAHCSIAYQYNSFKHHFFFNNACNSIATDHRNNRRQRGERDLKLQKNNTCTKIQTINPSLIVFKKWTKGILFLLNGGCDL